MHKFANEFFGILLVNKFKKSLYKTKVIVYNNNIKKWEAKSVTSHDLHQKRELLCNMLASLHKPEEIAILLDDLCTVKEIEQMDQRIRSAVLLMEGKTYTQVCDETGISTVTLSRVSRALQNGEGYSRLLRDYIQLTKEDTI